MYWRTSCFQYHPRVGAYTPSDVFARRSTAHQGPYAVVVLIVPNMVCWLSATRSVSVHCAWAMATGMAVASELSRLEGIKYGLDRDIQPGEAVFIDLTGMAMCATLCIRRACLSTCTWPALTRAGRYFCVPGPFEHGRDAGQTCHFNRAARPDRRGHSPSLSRHGPAPCSWRSCWVCRTAKALKNRYVGRTFIMPAGVRKIGAPAQCDCQ